LRFTGFEKDGRKSNCAFSVIANGDTNHVQLFLDIANNRLNFVVNIATASLNIPLPNNMDVWTYWTKFTVTYNTTGSKSYTYAYANGTYLGEFVGNGKVLRWHDQSTLILGAYALSATSTLIKERFVGWIDDLAFYSRVMSAAEIEANWQHAGNTSDSSLFIYYSMDEGPGATVIKNSGKIGSTADLNNGKIFGGLIYYDSASNAIRSVTEAKWVRN
jgi:hypothetical protein